MKSLPGTEKGASGSLTKKKLAYKTFFGAWDVGFNYENFQHLSDAFFSKLKPGGTLIVWIDL
jgi:hypothetical protein